MWDVFFDCNGSSALVLVLAVIPKYGVITNVEPRVRFQMSPSKEPQLFSVPASVFGAHRPVSQCRWHSMPQLSEAYKLVLHYDSGDWNQL
jgi:hypothetical protein